MPKTETLLVTGASGQLGRLVLDALVQSGEQPIIATTRTPERLADYAPKGVEVRAADYTKPEGLAKAFSGATRMLLISTQEVGTRLASQLAALEAAKKAGVRHIFYTSHSVPDTSVSVVAPEHAAMEKAIRESGLKYTFLRNFLYAENLLMTLPEALERGAIYGAGGDAKTAYVTRRDCADAAAGAMKSATAHEDMIYDITGPRGYSHSDLAEILSGIVGREIVYVDLPLADYKARLLEQGSPKLLVDALVSFERAHSLGELDNVTDAVQRLSGHAPEMLEDFLQDKLLSGDTSKSFEDFARDHWKV